MKISQAAIDKMPTGSKVRKRLAFEFDVYQTTIDRWIEANDDDGDLTKLKALQVIEEETGLTQDEILEKEPA